MSADRLDGVERRTAGALAGVFGLRMFGLFLLYPILAPYASRLPGATPFLVGLAIGVYGLTQALTQLPFGLASDRLGRKPLVTAGLALFVAGSIIAALSQGIGGIIVGRAVQGTGAVGAVILALAADLTRVEQRSRSMGIIGVGIGLAFGLAVVAGPTVEAWTGLAGIFWLTAALGLAGVVILWTVVPTPRAPVLHRETEAIAAVLRSVLRRAQLWRLYGSIFALHAMLAALFLVIPLRLQAALGGAGGAQWMFYLPVLVAALLLMLPLIVYAEGRGRLKPIAAGAILALAAAALAVGLAPADLIGLAIVLAVFFGAVTFMEALLPSLVSRMARPEERGTALGVYSTSQFLGIFVGGALGGALQGVFGILGLCAFVAALGLLWLPLFATLASPRRLASRMLAVAVSGDAAARRLARELEAVPGVAEAAVFADEGAASLRVDRQRLDETALRSALASAGRSRPA